MLHPSTFLGGASKPANPADSLKGCLPGFDIYTLLPGSPFEREGAAYALSLPLSSASEILAFPKFQNNGGQPNG
jgi:hypothetical protein